MAPSPETVWGLVRFREWASKHLFDHSIPPIPGEVKAQSLQHLIGGPSRSEAMRHSTLLPLRTALHSPPKHRASNWRGSGLGPAGHTRPAFTSFSRSLASHLAQASSCPSATALISPQWVSFTSTQYASSLQEREGAELKARATIGSSNEITSTPPLAARKRRS
jgi:hypothetical protein